MPHTALILAAKSGHNDIIALLINHGFDINRKLQGYSGNCLHEAVLYGKVETVRYLLQVRGLWGYVWGGGGGGEVPSAGKGVGGVRYHLQVRGL